jgi:cephalosporin-C deacetylase-like acetyl esterase
VRNLANKGDSAACRAELLAAGIEHLQGPVYGECHVFIFGLVGRWLLTRSWCYWVARVVEGHELAVEAVEAFDAVWGEQVRAHGYDGGGALHIRPQVESFHIDTPEGLAAFASFIREVPNA